MVENETSILVSLSEEGVWNARALHDLSYSASGISASDAVEALVSVLETLPKPKVESEDILNNKKSTLYCSFCGKSQHEVKKLIAGPTVFICDECTELCDEIIITESFPGRFVIRIRAPESSPLDDALLEAIGTSISQRYPDIDLKFEMKTYSSPLDAREGNGFAVYSFSKLYGNAIKDSHVDKTYEELTSELQTALSRVAVLNSQFIEQSERAETIKNELTSLKAEYLDYIREQMILQQEVSEIRAVMFLDISGFSKFDKIRKKKVVDMLRGIVPPLLDKRGAQELNMWGDAIVANFTDPNNAVEAAVKFIRHLSVEQLDSRIGMAWGKIRVSYNVATGRPDVDGEVVDFAARLEPMAPLGGILLSKEFGGLNINPAIGELVPVSLPVKKAFANYNIGDNIDLFSLAIRMN
jgi:hypothetical protein